MAMQHVSRAQEPAKASLLYDPKVRSIFFQVVLLLALIFGVWWIVDNTIDNLRRSNISTGFGFLRGRAGFDISDSLIQYSSDSSYGRAILVGFWNTVLVAITGIITATILGFIIGVGRLSRNWLLRKIAMIYVETSATSRRCSSSSSGISACCRCFRRRATASSCLSVPISTAGASTSRASYGPKAPG
jgi:general L-amino acid transport system permease protein